MMSDTKAEQAVRDLLDWMNHRGNFKDYPREVTGQYSSAQSAVVSLIPLGIAEALAEGYPGDPE